MPQIIAILKSEATQEQRLAYRDLLEETLVGLMRANNALYDRRDPEKTDEARRIDIQVNINNSDWSKVLAFKNLYTAENVKFLPPEQSELEEIKKIVATLDRLIVAQKKTHEIITATGKLIEAFNKAKG